MRITANKSNKIDDVLAKKLDSGHGSDRSTWAVVTGLGDGDMRLAVAIFKMVMEWQGGNATQGVILRPNLYTFSLTWGKDKFVVELFLPYFQEDNLDPFDVWDEFKASNGGPQDGAIDGASGYRRDASGAVWSGTGGQTFVMANRDV
jgi:hypothetical protein